MTQHETTLNQRDYGGRPFFLGFFALLAVLTILVIRPFLGTIGLAIILVVVLQPLYRFFLRQQWVGERSGWALILTFVSATLVILIPFYLLLTIAFGQGQAFLNDLTLPEGDWTIEEMLERIEQGLRQMLGNLLTFDTAGLADSLRTLAQSAARWLGNLAINLGMSIPALFTQLIVFGLLLVLWLPRYRVDLNRLVSLSPLPTTVTRLYLQKTTAMLQAMFRGVFIISFAQGATMGVFLWIAGVPFTFFLTVLAMFLAIFPVIGVFLIAFPVGIILLLTGQIWQGVLVIGGYLIVVANIDNVLRPMLVPKEAYLSPALVLLSVLGGIKWMGLLGAFYGPVILILFVTTFDVYAEYYAAAAHPATPTAGDSDRSKPPMPDGEIQSTGKNIAARGQR